MCLLFMLFFLLLNLTTLCDYRVISLLFSRHMGTLKTRQSGKCRNLYRKDLSGLVMYSILSFSSTRILKLQLHTTPYGVRFYSAMLILLFVGAKWPVIKICILWDQSARWCTMHLFWYACSHIHAHGVLLI